MKYAKRVTAALLAGVMFWSAIRAVPTLHISANEATYGGAPIAHHEGGYAYNDRTLVTHAYDFSMDRIGMYANDTALAMGNRAAAEIVDGHLTVKDGMSFAFGSAVCLGDDYGVEEGYLHFDVKLMGGKLHLGLRTSMTACEITDRGIWLTFDGSDTLSIKEPLSGLSASVPLPVSLSSVASFTVHEGLDTMTLSSNDSVIATVKYRSDGYLAFCGADGSILAETTESDLYPTGYVQFTLDDLDGYIDNVSFTNVESVRKVEKTEELRTIDYATWTATDAIDRTIADNAKAGAPKENRYVGLFYFLCCVGAGGVVSDNTRDYLEYGADGIKKRIEERAGEAYWAEPYFGYYINTDTWVYRKHAYMLEAAGVDFIFLDVSNGEVFIPGHMALFDTWLQMRNEGIDTPQIVFFNGDTTAFMESNMRKLFSTVYSDENWDTYKELFFEWDGKPLLFGNMSGVSSTMKTLINEKFTVRGCWAWQDQDNYWCWLQEYVAQGDRVRMENGSWGRDQNGKIEALSVAMGHHPVMNKGRSFVNRKQPNNGLGDFEFSSIEQAGKGLGFENQFKAVQSLVEANVSAEDPFCMMITGWNEWIAGGFTNEKPVTLGNTTCLVQYVDQFNPEFSRDGEPMRNNDGYGFGDNYYYQMVDYIRQFKGIAQTPVADHQGSVNIYDLSTWEDIELSYMDPLYDTEHRNTRSYDNHNRYINHTGRNDLASAKVSQDQNALYFLVTAAHDIIIDDGESWMNLYINIDGDASTGWEGFDYVLNRDRDSFVVTVETFKDNSYETEVVGGAYYYLNGDSMAIRVSKDILGVSGQVEKMVFKWADNSVTNGDAMGFMDLGDTAPDNRFGFLYLCEEYTTTPIPTTTLVANETDVPANGGAIEKPDHTINIEVEDIKIDVLYDLADIVPGQYVKDTKLGDQFEHMYGTSTSIAQILKGDGFNYIRMNGYSDLRTWNDVEGSYEFSTDIKMKEYGNSAVYVRGEMPGAYAPTNPKNFGIDQVFNYYEWDWYAENGGKTYGASSTAGSGIGIYPGENSITIRIKRYAEDGLGVASASHTFPYTDGFQPDASGWLALRVVDDGKTVSIYFNEALMAQVKLANPGVVYESDGTGQAYYGQAILCDAAGVEVLTVENTRINSVGSQLAITTRDRTIEFRNIYIAYMAQTATGSRVETSLDKQTFPTVSYTPDQRLVTTLSLGKDAPAETTDPKETVADPQDTDNPNTEIVDPEEPRKPDNKGCRSVLLTAALPLLLASAVLLLRRRDDCLLVSLFPCVCCKCNERNPFP